MGFLRSKGVKFTLGATLLVAAGVAGTGYVYNQKLEKIDYDYSLTIQGLQKQINTTTKSGYVSIRGIKTGETVNLDNVQPVQVTHQGADDLLLTEEDLGKIARIDIPEGVSVLNYMTYEFFPEDFREKECSFIRLNSNLSENDTVDIRILFPNGEDFVILSKKELKGLDLTNSNTFVWLNEEELLLLNSAVVDASITEGAFIYVNSYIEPSAQDESIITYVPSDDVLDLIRRDPNAVQKATIKMTKTVRKDLEERIKQFGKDNGAVTSIDVKNKSVSSTEPETTPEESIVDSGVTKNPDNLEVNFQGVEE